MSELRYNIITRDWVIIARERAKRPMDFKKAEKEKEKLPPHRADCPFCPGNEGDRSDETYRMGDDKNWRVRAVYNKFPALSHTEKPVRNLAGVHKSISGFGVHEVLIEHPLHNMTIPFMSDEDVMNIIRMYKDRYEAVQRVAGIEAVIIFKNHGSQAGSSLAHAHSQLVATPMVPPYIRMRIEQATRYSDVSGECMFCGEIKHELQEKARIVLETDSFVAFVPYAAVMPFIVWVLPRRHMASFDEINEEEIRDLARVMKTVLGKLYSALGDPDFNYTIRSIPPKEKGNEYFHWHINIIPRITKAAGFELGSGIFINASAPEDCAEFLRKAQPPD